MNEESKTVKFSQARYIITRRDTHEYMFCFSVVDSSLIRSPEEESKTKAHRIKVIITRTLASCWDLNDKDLEKVLFEYGKRYITEKLKEGTLNDKEELWLSTGSHPIECEFNPLRIPNPDGATFIVQMPKDYLKHLQISEDKEFPEQFKIVSSIIEFRDSINTIFYEENKERLLLLKQERILLDLFKEANSQEDFTHRVCALANIVASLNIKILRKLTKIDDKEMKSISLLEAYLKTLDNKSVDIIKIFRNIIRLRQRYPIHCDNVDGVVDAHTFFKIEYPVKEYNKAWKILINYYASALKKIYKIIS